MRIIIFISILILMTHAGCDQPEPSDNYVINLDWADRKVDLSDLENLTRNSTYLAVYNKIYERSQRLTYEMTITVSIRNTSVSDTLYLLNADYYNTEGEIIRKYLEKPVYITPLESVEIIIEETDQEGGSGGNFIFNWSAKENASEPLFESIMVSSRQPGISFSSQGVKM